MWRFMNTPCMYPELCRRCSTICAGRGVRPGDLVEGRSAHQTRKQTRQRAKKSSLPPY